MLFRWFHKSYANKIRARLCETNRLTRFEAALLHSKRLINGDHAVTQLPIVNLSDAEVSGANETGPANANAGSCGSSGQYSPDENRRLPKWLKRQIPKGAVHNHTAKLLDELRLETVCDNAKCPNRMECYS